MKQWLIIQENNKTHKEKIYKSFDNETEAIKYFDDMTLNRQPQHFQKYSYELHDCYGEIINATL